MQEIKYKGVWVSHRIANPYKANVDIKHNGKLVRISLGNYATAEEAFKARLQFINKLK